MIYYIVTGLIFTFCIVMLCCFIGDVFYDFFVPEDEVC